MASEHRFSLGDARKAAERDDLNRWVREFLGSPGSDNEVLGEKLTEPPRWWSGPMRLPIDQLHRLAGPPDQPVLCPVEDEQWWRDDVDEMEEKVQEGWEPPPVIVSWRNGQLVLEDGNHRVESLRRAGETAAWSLVGFDSVEARERFVPPDTEG